MTLCLVRISHLGRRTGCCIAASWQGGASTCSDVPAWPFPSAGVRSSLGGTGSRGGRRWWCTVSMGRHASGEHRPLWSSSSGSWACQWKHTLKKKREGPICFKVYQPPLTCKWNGIYLRTPPHILSGTLVVLALRQETCRYCVAKLGPTH